MMFQTFSPGAGGPAGLIASGGGGGGVLVDGVGPSGGFERNHGEGYGGGSGGNRLADFGYPGVILLEFKSNS